MEEDVHSVPVPPKDEPPRLSRSKRILLGLGPGALVCLVIVTGMLSMSWWVRALILAALGVCLLYLNMEQAYLAAQLSRRWKETIKYWRETFDDRQRILEELQEAAGHAWEWDASLRCKLKAVEDQAEKYREELEKTKQSDSRLLVLVSDLRADANAGQYLMDTLRQYLPIEKSGGDSADEEGKSSKLALASYRRQLVEEEGNLLLIQERLAQHVLETDRPLELVKEERRKQKAVGELRRRIRELEQSKGEQLM